MESPDLASGLVGTSDVLLAPGAISIHRSGLEAAFSKPLDDWGGRSIYRGGESDVFEVL